MDCKDYFERVAGRWDKMRQSFFSDKVREVAVSRAGARPGELAADIGAGTGFMTEELVRRGLRIIAVDQSEAMIQEMKRKFGRFDTVQYKLGTFDSLPIPDEKLDYVFANMYLHYVEVPQVAVDEMVRVLKPGGKLVITDMDEHDFQFLKKEQHDRWMGFKRDEVAGWFEKAGLKNVKLECEDETCCADSVECGERASVSIFVAYGEKA